jgi:hypothetical protein
MPIAIPVVARRDHAIVVHAERGIAHIVQVSSGRIDAGAPGQKISHLRALLADEWARASRDDLRAPAERSIVLSPR